MKHENSIRYKKAGMSELGPVAARDKLSPILFLGTQMALAGAQNVLLTQARWFHGKGHHVVVAFFYDKEGLAARWREVHPFPIIDLRAWKADGSWLGNYLRLILGLIRLYTLMVRERFAVVETFTPHSNVLGVPLAWLARVPVRVATHHGLLESTPRWLPRLHSWMVNRGIASRLVVVSQRVRQTVVELEGVQPERVVVLSNGIDPSAYTTEAVDSRANIRRELGLEEHTKLILTVGRFTVQKGHTYLLDAIPRVLSKYPYAIFGFAGDGPERKFLEDKARQLKIDVSLRFLGRRSDVPALLKAADLFVLPSLSEGLPLALLEALAVGLPVVTTRFEGVEEVVEHEKNGLIVSIKDSDAIAESIVRMLDSDVDRVRFGRAGKKLVKEQYSAENMCVAYEQLFHQLYQEVAP